MVIVHPMLSIPCWALLRVLVSWGTMAVLWVNRSAWVVNAFLVLVDILLDVCVDRSAPLVLFVSF